MGQVSFKPPQTRAVSTAFDPATLAGKLLWLRAKDLGSNGSSVTTWADQSGLSAPPFSITNTTVVTGATPSSGKTARLANATIYLVPHAGAVYASSELGGFPQYTAMNLVDGNTGTHLATDGGAPQTITQRMATSYAATEYIITGTSSALTSAPSAWTFQGSQDTTTWTTLDTRSSITFSGTTAQTFTFSNSTAYAYYRLNISAPTSPASGQIWLSEFTITGATLYTLPSVGETWIVIKSNDTTGTAWKMGSSGNSSHFTFSGTVYDDSYTSTRQSFTPSPTVAGAWRLYRVKNTAAGAWQAWVDNTSQLSATSTFGRQARPLLAGGWTGDIAEVLMRSQVSTTQEVTDLITYFNTEHGLTVT
jgi:predicted secreted protein